MNILIYLFPLWALAASSAAFFFPELFVSMKGYIIPLLTIIMLGMGMTLTFDDFKKVIKTPQLILLGIIIQYVIMPLAAFFIAISFGFGAELVAGMVLVGSSPGGTASNVMTYLAGGRVALSISLTMASTLLAVVLTPLISYIYINQYIDVPAWEMFVSVFQIVLLPVLAGTVLNSYFGKRLVRLKSFMPLISSLAIILIIAIIVALNSQKIFDFGLSVIFAVIIHNLIGLFSGYYITKLLKYDEQTCRTLSIEVGMQNSGLAVALAIKFYGAIASIPGAIFSVWHNLSGSILASYWRKIKNPTDK